MHKLSSLASPALGGGVYDPEVVESLATKHWDRMNLNPKRFAVLQ